MSSSTFRRRFLQVAAGGGVAVLGGCLDSGSSPAPETSKPTVLTSEPPDELRTDDLYVKNDDHDVERVSIRLVRVDGDENRTVLDEDYRFPRTTQMVVPDVGEQGEAYEISVAVEGERAATETWDVRTCEGTEAPRGNRDVEVRIDDEVEVVKNACDAIWVESRNAIDHAEFLVEGERRQTTEG